MVKIAYLIQAHKGYDQIIVLINSLELSTDDIVIIHIDSKNIELRTRLTDSFLHEPNVVVVQDSISVFWSGFSQVYATLKMFSILKEFECSFDYCILLSGEDVLLKSTKYLKDYLHSENKTFIDCSNVDIQSYRIERYNFFRDFKYNRSFFIRVLSKLLLNAQYIFPKRTNFSDLKLFKGSQWFVIKYQHWDYLMNEYITDGFISRFKRTSCADEYFFQIALINSVGFENIESRNLHYIHFSDGCSSPDYLDIADLIGARSEKPPLFFARKVTNKVQLDYLKCVDFKNE